MVERRHITVRGIFSNIPRMIEFVSDAARAAGLSEDEVFHCQMAVDEACTNVIEHAYGGEDHGDIDITCVIDAGNSCTIIIEDSGIPFEPDNIPVPELARDVASIEPGGLGLHLMRQMMSEVVFDFRDGCNILRMRKDHVQLELLNAVPLSVESVSDSITVIEPGSRLDAAASPELDDALTTLREDVSWFVIDMSRTEYVSSRGLKVLVSHWRAVRERGGGMVLCALQPNVLAIFETVGFTEVFDLYVSRTDALSAIESKNK